MCGGCGTRGIKTYPCQMGKPASLCSKCYATKLRKALEPSGFSKSVLEDRYRELTTDPDCMEQWMGVCGFAACIHEILGRVSKTQVRDLFEATFHDLVSGYDAVFVMADGTPSTIPFVELIGRPATVALAYKSGYLVDWCLCRALMYLLKVKDSTRYAREVDFSNQFNIPKWNEVGHFAIQTDSLAYVARTLLGLKVLWVLKQDYARTVKVKRESTPQLTQASASLDVQSDVYQRGLNMAREMEFMLDGGTAMFTALWADHLTGWTDNGVADTEIEATINGKFNLKEDDLVNLPFNHWVIINKAKLSTDKRSVTVSLWTWHTRREITYPVRHVTKYLREAVFVKL
jgi:hypothetical protein